LIKIFQKLILQLKKNLPGTRDAETLQTSSYSFEITLDSTKLAGKSKEYIASAVFHEILHNYLDLKFPRDADGNNQVGDGHNAMADKYITLLTGALRNTFPNLPLQDAWALSWIGLEKTNMWTGKTFKKDDANNIDEKRDMKALQDKHKDKNAIDKRGTYCN